MELIMFYRKIASRAGWGYVITNFLYLSFILDNIREASYKFGVDYLYDAWIKHAYLAVSVSSVITTAVDFDYKKGKNYQIILKKIFGGI